jgi:hypothetical protein
VFLWLVRPLQEGERVLLHSMISPSTLPRHARSRKRQPRVESPGSRHDTPPRAKMPADRSAEAHQMRLTSCRHLDDLTEMYDSGKTASGAAVCSCYMQYCAEGGQEPSTRRSR